MKKNISIILICLIIATFFLRIGSYSKEHNLTYDEVVYSTLAAQIIQNPANYNTIGLYYRDTQEKGVDLPEYFKNPLFKHPPLFSKLVTISYKLFGQTYFSAFKVSLLFGILLIALAYLLGSLLFDNKIGVYAAFLMSIEPVSWISSQKIWMETTLAFFTVLSLYLFIRAVKKYNPYFVIASGVSAGLAVLCKYPGILATGIILLYALCSERWLFKKKSFIFSLFVPFLMLVPWLEWNYRIYGTGLFTANIEMVRILSRMGFFIRSFWGIFLLAALILVFLVGAKRRAPAFYEQVLLPKLKIFKWIAAFGLFLAVIFILRAHTINVWDLFHMPQTGWRIGMFQAEPWYFYLGRLAELSPFYLFSFAALLFLVLDKQHLKDYSFLFIASGTILALYILWGNYQCRYITAITVPLMVLSARVQVYILDKASSIGSKTIKYAVQSLIILILIYAAIKTLRVDVILAVPNSICYF